MTATTVRNSERAARSNHFDTHLWNRSCNGPGPKLNSFKPANPLTHPGPNRLEGSGFRSVGLRVDGSVRFLEFSRHLEQHDKLRSTKQAQSPTPKTVVHDGPENSAAPSAHSSLHSSSPHVAQDSDLYTLNSNLSSNHQCDIEDPVHNSVGSS